MRRADSPALCLPRHKVMGKDESSQNSAASDAKNASFTPQNLASLAALPSLMVRNGFPQTAARCFESPGRSARDPAKQRPNFQCHFPILVFLLSSRNSPFSLIGPNGGANQSGAFLLFKHPQNSGSSPLVTPRIPLLSTYTRHECSKMFRNFRNNIKKLKKKKRPFEGLLLQRAVS